MKTVIDAVNNFKGIFPYSDAFYIIHWYNPHDGGLFEFSNMIVGNKPNSNWYPVCTKELFNQCVEDCSNNFGKEVKPTYTQAMANHNILPLVGMKCCYSSLAEVVWNICTVIAYYDGYVWTSDNGIRMLSNTKFKPIDTRTDTDKAYDDMETAYKTLTLETFISCIKTGDFHGVTFTGSK